MYPSAIAPDDIIPGSLDFTSQLAAIPAIVLVIEYWDLRFICNLVLEIYPIVKLC